MVLKRTQNELLGGVGGKAPVTRACPLDPNQGLGVTAGITFTRAPPLDVVRVAVAASLGRKNPSALGDNHPRKSSRDPVTGCTDNMTDTSNSDEDDSERMRRVSKKYHTVDKSNLPGDSDKMFKN